VIIFITIITGLNHSLLEISGVVAKRQWGKCLFRKKYHLSENLFKKYKIWGW